MPARRVLAALAGATAALVLLPGCFSVPASWRGDAGDQPQPLTGLSAPPADCAPLATPPADAPPADAAPAAGQPASVSLPMPELTLPCLADEAPFPLPELAGPAVVNLWASWCLPCVDELPVLQRLHERADGQLHVVGVATADRRPAAAALADELGVRFPSLLDPQERLITAVEMFGLPITLFVAADGSIVRVYQGQPYDDQQLAELVEESLGVAVDDG